MTDSASSLACSACLALADAASSMAWNSSGSDDTADLPSKGKGMAAIRPRGGIRWRGETVRGTSVGFSPISRRGCDSGLELVQLALQLQRVLGAPRQGGRQLDILRGLRKVHGGGGIHVA